MARIAGIEIENEKRVWVALLGIYGVGETSAKEMCKKTKIDENTKIKDLTEVQLDVIRKYIEENFVVEGELRQNIFRDIKRLKDIKSYRGSRHAKRLPVRGQRTKTNSRTVRGNVRNLATSGNKPVAQKT